MNKIIECPVYRYDFNNGKMLWDVFPFEVINNGRTVVIPKTISIVKRVEKVENGIGLYREIVYLYDPPRCIYSANAGMSFDPFDNNIYLPIKEFESYKAEITKEMEGK